MNSFKNDFSRVTEELVPIREESDYAKKNNLISALFLLFMYRMYALMSDGNIPGNIWTIYLQNNVKNYADIDLNPLIIIFKIVSQEFKVKNPGEDNVDRHGSV